MAFHKAALKVAIPANKFCYGDDNRKLWCFTIPALIFSLELEPCLLFLNSDSTHLEFWLLVAMQELNSVGNNTGYYLQLYVYVYMQGAWSPN